MPKGLADFAGPSYFGGKNNELILCAGKSEDPTPLLYLSFGY